MPAPGGAEILIVDDDADVRRSFAAILCAHGYQVREAASGLKCLEEIEAAPPALVLLDVTMPELDGIETLRRLRAGPHRDVPVILLTGHRLDPESIGSGLELGAEEYLGKPVAPAELTARIRALLHLHAARRELEALKRDQTAMLVHDLKQPLAIIVLRAELIADEAIDPELRRSGRAIRDACRQMELLIHSVLELSRIEAGEMRLTRAHADLCAVTREVVEQLRDLAERRRISLAVALPDRAVDLAFDRMKIAQVVQNLLGNALKFTPAGGRIDVSLATEDDEARVTVEDTGCGIPDEGGRLFDKWQQAADGRARGGSGLGLAIARAIVEAHGGAIGATGRTDGRRGARFWFSLPLAAGQTARAAG